MSGERAQEFSLHLKISRKMHERLEELRQAAGKGSVEEIGLQALDSYVRRCASADGLARLTPRQREVLQLIAEGQRTREIARQLSISVKTVEMHRAQLMETLELRNIAEVVRFAVRAGVISP
jgi:DNA-binding CsgD family transcriptional regulator